MILSRSEVLRIRASNIFKTTFLAIPGLSRKWRSLRPTPDTATVRFADHGAACVLAHMDEQYTHALVLEAKTDGCEPRRVSHGPRF